jgi:hypothetical protein
MRFSYRDLLIELIDSCFDYVREVRSQLNFYKASVYKEEIARNIKKKTGSLRVLCCEFNSSDLEDFFDEFDSLAKLGGNAKSVVSSSLPERTVRLLQQVEPQLKEIKHGLTTARTNKDAPHVVRNLRRKKRILMSACRRGSRPWSLLNLL